VSPDQGSGPSISESALIERIGWLINLRWLAAGALFIAIAAARLLLGQDVPFLPLLTGNLLLAASNFGYLFLFRRLEPGRTRAPALANAQITLDLLILTYLVHLSGGIESPFVLFFIFHMVIASILLSNRDAYLQAGFATLATALATVGEQSGIIRHHTIEGLLLPSGGPSGWAWLARWSVLSSTLFITVYLSTTIVNRLRSKERELEELNRRLLENDRVKSRYVMTVSHDIRGSLSAIQSSLRVVLDGYTEPIPQKAREMIERAELRSEQLQRFVKDLLDLSRMRAAGQMTREMIDVTELLAEAVARSQSLLEEKSLSASVEDRAEDSTLCANREALDHLLENLLGNAIRYTPRGGRISLELEDAAAPGWLQLHVRDTGIGIPEEELPHIFEDFYRAKNARQYVQEGTGLGLSIVKQIVEAHGGGVRAKSEPGGGTTITVSLPGKSLSCGER
jgi:signal transduction histidine kinase